MTFVAVSDVLDFGLARLNGILRAWVFLGRWRLKWLHEELPDMMSPSEGGGGRGKADIVREVP